MRGQDRELSLLVEGFAIELKAAAKSGGDQQSGCGIFDSTNEHKLPSVDLQIYLKRWAKYTRSASECFTLAAIYIKRVGILLTPCSVHRVAFTALMLASKYVDDFYYTNSYYNVVGGVSLKSANAMEKLFLTLIHWDLYVSEDEYQHTFKTLCRVAEKKQLSSSRGCILPNYQHHVSDFDFVSSDSETYSDSEHDFDSDIRLDDFTSKVDHNKSLFSQSAKKIMSLFGLQK